MTEKDQPQPWGARRRAALEAAEVAVAAVDAQEATEAPEAPQDDFYEVSILLPIPVTPMGALGIVIGKAFPGSTIYFGDDAPRGHMTMRLPKAAVAAVIDQDAEEDE